MNDVHFSCKGFLDAWFDRAHSGSHRLAVTRTYDLAALSFRDAETALGRGAIALLPTGATEAHGPHLPLSTDVVISLEAARRAARSLDSTGHAALVLPPLAYGVTEFASGFSGTVSLPFETATALVRDVIRGAMRTGFRGVVVCNAHLEPENLRAIRQGVEAANAHGARAAFPDVTRKPHALRLGDEFKSGACHAGRYETSLVLAADAALVDAAGQKALPPNPSSLSRAIKEGKTSFQAAGGPQAYFGWPADATATEGDALYAELADIFASAARALLESDAATAS